MNAGSLHEIFLTPESVIRCQGSLSKLRRHVVGPLVITGGIAVGQHLLNNDARMPKAHLNDIDLVVKGLPCLYPTVGQDFLIRHFHPTRERGKILIMLVDEVHGTRIDIFTPSTDALIGRSTDFTVGEMPFKLISAEDLLAKLLSILYAVKVGRHVEPKYLEHFRSLLILADPKAVRDVWREYRKDNQPLEFEAAVKDVEHYVTSRPTLLRKSAYSQDIDQECSWCQESDLYPLAPLTRIHEILGYV